MKCPKCGSENFRCTMEKGTIANKRLPLWVGVVSIIASLLILPICTIENLDTALKALLSIIILIGFYGGIAYLIVRGIRLSKEKQITIIQYKCEDCGYEQLEKVK